MPLDVDKALKWLTDNSLPPYGNGICATHIRKGLEAGGFATAGHPAAAKDWGPTLTRGGFKALASTAGYVPVKGDVAVIQGVSTGAGRAGHIEMFDGKDWVSDFIQPRGKEIYPGPQYRAETPSYVIYRF